MLINFSFLFNLGPLKVTKAVVKQKKLISVLKGKDIISFTPGRPHSVVHRTPSTSRSTVSLASTSSSTKGKDKEMPFHGFLDAARKELFTSKSVFDISVVPAATSNSSTTADVKLFHLKAGDMELEEGEIVSLTPSSLQQVNQAVQKMKTSFIASSTMKHKLVNMLSAQRPLILPTL